LELLLSNGTHDPSFAVAPSLLTYATSLALQSNLKLLVTRTSIPNDGGFLGSSAGLIRLNSDGSLDHFFQSATPGNALAVQTNEKIIVGYEGIFTRLNADGSQDVGFRGDIRTSVGLIKINAAAIQADGKLVVGGSFESVDGNSRSNLVRLEVDGSLDVDFNIGSGVNGKVRTLAIDADGRILAGGSFTSFDGVRRVGICRLIAGSMRPSPPLITRQPLSQSVSAGRDVVLSVTDVGFPYPEYQWFRNGSAVRGATNSALSLKNIQPEDAGVPALGRRPIGDEDVEVVDAVELGCHGGKGRLRELDSFRPAQSVPLMRSASSRSAIFCSRSLSFCRIALRSNACEWRMEPPVCPLVPCPLFATKIA
jgi:uncharacterized delta-60 repeat protein